jgi:tRNA (cmo5U34)-methyltransferase
MKSPDQVWKAEELGKRYLEGVRGAIPWAQEQIDLLLRIATQAQPRVKRVLDLGCGDGILGRAVLARYPEAAGVFVDFSDTMLAAAREKMPARANATFLCQDYGKAAWVESVGRHAPFDLIVSGFSIHHQPDTRKKVIYKELFDLLVPGGLFLNLEHVASSSPWVEGLFDQLFVEALCRYHQGQGTAHSAEQIAHEYYHRPDKAANILAPVWEQCAWLREIGFEDVDCYFKILELALFGGRAPLK